ncbi:hypothetical protein SAMN06269185_1117 [Natronoarchaeum philippinense]|uniref:Type II toxin-antitoxin system HicB family antitoxin n=1 Tax=Natronoarchaeum philippinense TaxID=558529 RepID=A0A285N9X1_NATPI|nr:HicB family protein [Natronoarchaeum philippinense]SNZ06292.1 hypothetical protein SAMN06269185_1117 [Natronoarchaeum philippinense]
MGVQSRDGAVDDTITVTRGDEYYVAKDESTGIASQGETKADALQNLAEALELAAEPVDDEVSDHADAPWFSS